MLTETRLTAELKVSEAREEATYRSLTLELFRGLQSPLGDEYDRTIAATDNLRAITPEAVRSRPQIIRILRYCLAPVISQMRLGQIVGTNRMSSFEEKGTKPAEDVAKKLARWFGDYLDRNRFPWTVNPLPLWSAPETAIAEHYAKLCTVSLLSNQNTDTLYRNDRKRLQESAIETCLRTAGLSFQERVGPLRMPGQQAGPAGIGKLEDMLPGHFVRGCVIRTGLRRKQQPDLTLRLAKQPSVFVSPTLFCVEAKAVGIRIDSTKRFKELNDKFTDWSGCPIPIRTIGVIAGFFNAIELIATIRAGIPLFFEHDLAQFSEFLRTGNYFGSLWDPTQLFPDRTPDQLQQALGIIESG